MKLGILLSGGKDSVYAAYLSSKNNEITCAITIKSLNKESYMFHTPNIDLVKYQTDSMDIPLIIAETQGVKEEELLDLKKAIAEAKEKYKLEGIVTGAVASVYQAERIQKICDELNLKCLNPLWQINQIKLLEELLKNKFEVIIGGVFAYPFDETLLGKFIDKDIINMLKRMEEKYKINPAGEGGEIETFVTDCPLFKKKIKILKANIEFENHSGVYNISEAKLIDKE